MKLLSVGGVWTGCGKTAVVSLLLKAFPGWGAVKVTPCRPGHVCPLGEDCGACEPPDQPYEVITDDAVLSRVGKDTATFLGAGASRVAWIRSLPKALPAALQSALCEFSDLPGVIVESTTAMTLVDGPRILVAKANSAKIKNSARTCAGMISILALNVDRQHIYQGIPTGEGAVFRVLKAHETTRMCATLPPEHKFNARFVEAVRHCLEIESGTRTIPSHPARSLPPPARR